MSDRVIENVIEWLDGDKEVWCTFSQKKFINKVRKLAEENPNEVKIVHTNGDGSIVAVLPLKFVSIRKPRQLSEEQVAKIKERGFGGKNAQRKRESEETE